MSDQRIISAANLVIIERTLSNLSDQIRNVHGDVYEVQGM